MAYLSDNILDYGLAFAGTAVNRLDICSSEPANYTQATDTYSLGTVTAWDVTNGYQDVTATVLTGAASASGDVITTPLVGNLTAGHRYRIEVRFTAEGNTFEPWFEVQGER